MQKTLGTACREIRELCGLELLEVADELRTSVAELVLIERGIEPPNEIELAGMRRLFGICPYIYCGTSVDTDKLPAPIRYAATQLIEAWQKDIAERFPQ